MQKTFIIKEEKKLDFIKMENSAHQNHNKKVKRKIHVEGNICKHIPKITSTDKNTCKSYT